MADVHIYPEHREICDYLINTKKVTTSVSAGTDTGPFKSQIDAYLFAASLGTALGTISAETNNKGKRKDATAIKQGTFENADGAREILNSTWLSHTMKQDPTDENLADMLAQITNADNTDRFNLLDNYAHAGFEWLSNRQLDEANVRDLIFSAIDAIGVDCESDPLLGV